MAAGGRDALGQIAFHFKDDRSYREIDIHTPEGDLRATHFAYDLAPVRQDPNTVFPVAPLTAQVAAGLRRLVRAAAHRAVPVLVLHAAGQRRRRVRRDERLRRRKAVPREFRRPVLELLVVERLGVRVALLGEARQLPPLDRQPPVLVPRELGRLEHDATIDSLSS